MKQTKEFENLGVKVTVEASTPQNIDASNTRSIEASNTRSADMSSVELAAKLNARGVGEFIPMGGKTVARKKEDGTFAVVEDNDPIVQGILNQGTIYNAHLFRQHVLSQMMHQMADGKKKYNEYVNGLDYEYMLKTMGDEFKRQEAQYRQKDSWFGVNNRFFNAELAYLVVMDMVNITLPAQIRRLKVHKCQGRKYVVIRGLNRLWKHTDRNMIFLADLDLHIYSKYRAMAEKIRKAADPIVLNGLWKKFMEQHIRIDSGYYISWEKWDYISLKYVEQKHFMRIETPEVWRDAYKGYGAWWSMQNLIEYHGCKLHYDGKVLDRQESMNVLNLLRAAKANDHDVNPSATHKGLLPGWWFLGMLRHLMNDNNIDPQKMIEGWRKK